MRGGCYHARMDGHQRIGMGPATLMVLFALVVDGIQAFLTLIIIGLFVNPVINLMVAPLFSIWFSHYGEGMMSRKNFAPFMGTAVAEFIPALNAFPLWTGFVCFTIGRNRLAAAMEEVR